MGKKTWSCITGDIDHCIICGKPAERHHVFGAANRRLSTEDGLIIPLCPEHHRTGRNAVHMDGDTAALVHIIGELAWIENNKLPFEDREMAIERFRNRYGKNYI